MSLCVSDIKNQVESMTEYGTAIYDQKASVYGQHELSRTKHNKAMTHMNLCADGRPQWEYTAKYEVSSPTVSLEAMILYCTIDAEENRYEVVTDIPGAFYMWIWRKMYICS